jgi:hypothetical protein
MRDADFRRGWCFRFLLLLPDYPREPILSYVVHVSDRFYQRMLIRVHESLKEEGKD